MYFTVTCKYLKPDEDGGEGMKSVSNEKYLVDAMTVTEAEAKVKNWFPNNYQDLEVTAAGMFDLDSIITVGDDEDYFLGRVKFSETTKKGTLKWYSFQVMVNGKDLLSALQNMIAKYKDGATSDYVMGKIEDSKIILDDDLVQK